MSSYLSICSSRLQLIHRLSFMVLSENTDKLWDIKDGVAIHDLKGPDGEPFLDGFKHSKLVLVYVLFIGPVLTYVHLLSP